jgi:sulfide:quinone oxidoreductase
MVVACGARLGVALPGAVTFWGTSESAVFESLLAELEAGDIRDITFAMPAAHAWSLPLYELALMTATRLSSAGMRERARLTFVTPEAAPLEVFGPKASARAAELLDAAGIRVVASTYAAACREGTVELVPHGSIAADRVVSLPRITGPGLEGLTNDEEGFVVVDLHGLVAGTENVYAAGDVTNLPVKQGGLAAQQADVVAEWIASRLGASVHPRAFRPVMRGLLFTGAEPEFLRYEAAGGGGEGSATDRDALWWPPDKIAGRYLAPYLAALSSGKRHGVGGIGGGSSPALAAG